MKICIPFAVQDVGGTSMFFKKFTESLRARDIKVTHNPNDEYDILFVIASCPLRIVFQCKKRKKKIVQRRLRARVIFLNRIKRDLEALKPKTTAKHLQIILEHELDLVSAEIKSVSRLSDTLG